MSTHALQPLQRYVEALSLGLFLLVPLALGCARVEQVTPAEPPTPAADAHVEEDHEHIASLEREIERLRSDLGRAEATRLATDSEVRAGQNRTVAVSRLAEARISVEQAATAASWSAVAIHEARLKIADGEHLLESGDPAAAAYFASRAMHIAETLLAEARQVEDSPRARFVRVTRLNLRAGPATAEPVLDVLESGTPVFAERSQGAWIRVRTLPGEFGWVDSSLLSGGQLEAREEPELESAVAETDLATKSETNQPAPAEMAPMTPAPGRVARATFATDVVDREPTDSVATLETDRPHVFYFSELQGMQGRTITHRWEYGSQVLAEVHFAVAGPRWRIFSRKNLGLSRLGDWSVSVVDESGQVLRTDHLAYTEAAEGVDPSVPAAQSP